MTGTRAIPRVPSRSWYDPLLNATMHTGTEALRIAEAFVNHEGFRDTPIAFDIETPGLDDVFTINCVTAAWEWPDSGEVQTILLDPGRIETHANLTWALLKHAKTIAFHNCFSGDTEVVTREGVRTFKSMEGETVEVWSAGSWRKALARCYGTAPTQRIHVRPARYRTNVKHTFDSTPNHRWPLVDGRLVETQDLRPGDLIQAARPTPEINHTSEAFKHGLIFADGALYTNQPKADGIWGFQIRLCGAKAKWAHLFDQMTYPPSANGDPLATGKLSFNPKELPIDPDAEYIANFIEGWQVMDGCKFGNGREVDTVRANHADWLMRHAAVGGWYATGRNSRETGSSSYKPGGEYHRVILSRGDGKKPVQWRVTQIDPPTDPVPVYCVEVPGIERFTLAQGVYTGNCPFDIPPLYHAGLIDDETIRRIVDTLLLARMAFPNVMTPKSLTALATRRDLLGWNDNKGGLEAAFKAAGFKTQTAGFEGMDIDSPIYRYGAMADTVATLRLEPLLRQKCRDWLTDHPFQVYGATTAAEADALIATQETVHRVMLRRSAVGLAVDREYLDRYSEQVDVERNCAVAELAVHGLEGGSGKGLALVKYLDSRGELPANWPRTATRQLSSAKGHLEMLDHPLANAQRKLANIEKVLGYLNKVSLQARVTGRCHPQVGTLGASATGRMCVPTTHGILTSRGVLKWGDVKIGDWTIDMSGNWVQVTGVYKYEDQPTVIREGRNARIESTTEHRWVTRSEFGKVRVEPIKPDQRKSLILAPIVKEVFDTRTMSFPDDMTASERLAALIGMLVTDGRYSDSGNGHRAYVYQTEDKFHKEFMRVIPSEAIMYDRVTETGTLHHEIRIKTRWLRPLLKSSGINAGTKLLGTDPALLNWVLGLTDTECSAFLRAVYMSDGVIEPTSVQSITCEHSATRDAVKMAAYRLGLRTYEQIYPPSEWGTKPIVRLCFSSKSPWTRYMSVSPGLSDVWCVTTTSGTFTAWDDGPYLTGNSMGSPELQQFPAEARPVICDDGQGLTSIDWSQIEPVVMGCMARDVEFLAPYEAGDDLYEPIMRACGVDRKTSKVTLLQTMYGSGVRKLAETINHTEESAAQIKRQMFAAMPKCERWMSKVQGIAEQHGVVITAGGRILPVDVGFEYKATNYVVQGSAYDVLAHTIVEMDRRGIGDRLHLALHDEVIVDTEAASEVQEIMTTPPPFLIKWADRSPVLRTDRADMQHAWAKV